MSTNSGRRDAPPTRKPSMLGQAMRDLMNKETFFKRKYSISVVRGGESSNMTFLTCNLILSLSLRR